MMESESSVSFTVEDSIALKPPSIRFGQAPVSGVGTLAETETGERFGSANAWARTLGYSDRSVVHRFLKRKAVFPYMVINYHSRPIALWHERDLEELIARTPTHLDPPKGFARIELIETENGDWDEIGSIEQWTHRFSGITPRSMEVADVTPTVQLVRGLPVRFLTRSQVDHILRFNQARYQGGVYVNPESGVRWATVRAWSTLEGFSHEYYSPRLREIGAVAKLPPEDAKRHFDVLYTFHAIQAAREHEINRLRPSTEVSPDPILGTVVGSLKAWARLLAVDPHFLSRRLPPAAQPLPMLGGRNRAKVFSIEQIQEAWPEAFTPPQWVAQQPGKLILPVEGKRYITLSHEERQLAIQRGIQSVEALNTRGCRATFFREEDVVLYRRRQHRSVEPITNFEYIDSVTHLHPMVLARQRLECLQRQANALIKSHVTLNTQGELYLNRRRLVPISRMRELVERQEASEQQRLTAALQELVPIAIADVTWPGHWLGKARLWLYDFYELFTDLNQAHSTDTYQRSATPAPLDVYVRQHEQQQAENRRVQQASEQAARQRRADYVARIEALESTSTQGISKKEILFKDRLIRHQGQLYGTPSTWSECYARTFPELTISYLTKCMQSGQLREYTDKTGVVLLCEKEILQLLVTFLDARKW